MIQGGGRQMAREIFTPDQIIAKPDSCPANFALLERRSTIEGKAAARECQNFACQMPMTAVEVLSAQLQS